jgi:hypothetical protein
MEVSDHDSVCSFLFQLVRVMYSFFFFEMVDKFLAGMR